MKTLIHAMILIFSTTLFITASAQNKITPQQVKEILISNVAGGMEGSQSANIRVVNEAGKWNSYLMRKDITYMMQRFKSSNNVLKLITVIPAVVVNDMLSGIAVIKPKITRSTFNLTAPKLIAELKSGAKKTVTNPPAFEKLITQRLIDSVISKTVVKKSTLDVYEGCEVDIITQQNDTVKVTADTMCPTMQPWTIGHHTTYDMTINNFIVAAVGNENVPNKFVLNIASLKESIYKAVDAQHQDAPIANFKWEYYYPKQLKMLKAHFPDIKTRFMNDNIYYCSLRTAGMPPAAFLESTMDMTNNEDISKAIAYAKLIDKYFKTDNFVLKYYGNLPGASIGFLYITDNPTYISLNFLKKKLPELAKVDSSQVISFFAHTTDDASKWIIFPDNKSLLTYHLVTTPDGKTAPIYPPQDPNANWAIRSDTYYLFDTNGKVLTTGYGFN